jgi:nicotinamidase-related amidase
MRTRKETPVVNADRELDRHIAPDLRRSALVVIDTQNDFVDGGSNAIHGTTQVLPEIRGLLAAYRSGGRPVVHVVRLYDGQDVDLPRRTAIAQGAQIVRPGTRGSQIVSELRPNLDASTLLAGAAQHLGPNEIVMWKPRWSAFYRTGLDRHLAGLDVNTVVFAGCNYPNCPRASIYDASELDYRVAIVRNAISGIDDRHLDEASRIGVVALSTEGVTETLARMVDTPNVTAPVSPRGKNSTSPAEASY